MLPVPATEGYAGGASAWSGPWLLFRLFMLISDAEIVIARVDAGRMRFVFVLM